MTRHGLPSLASPGHPIAYIPTVYCICCSCPVVPDRHHDIKSGRRLLRARCHGALEVLDFASEPDQWVPMWGENDAGP
jgi:hypothetical protein